VAVVPRVLAIQAAIDVDGVELAVAADGPGALASLDREPFDAVVIDLALAPLDGWMTLAELGSRSDRPRVIAKVADRADIPRALVLGADLCVVAGTTIHARALAPTWQTSTRTSFPSPTKSGVPA
jgi:DNA-binding response OmpR family regulator